MSPAPFFSFSAWLDQVQRGARAAVVGVLLVVSLLLTACGTPQPLHAAPAKAPAFIAVGTLATNGCELQTAPTYTAAITAVRVAEARLRNGALSVATAEAVLQLGRAARVDLDAACPNKTLDSQRLKSAQAAVARMQSLLGG